MTLDDCFYLGKIVRKHSFKGEVMLKLDTDFPENYQKMDAVLLETSARGGLVPFFIASSTLSGEFLRVKFEDVNDEAAADAIVGKKVFLPLQMLPALSEDEFYFHEIIGFQVIDKRMGPIGHITSVNENGIQELFVIDHDETEILIPIIDHFIEKVDKKNKAIHVDTPQGLIEMYLESTTSDEADDTDQ